MDDTQRELLLIEQLAEVRATQATTAFLLITIIEELSGSKDSDVWLRSYDHLQTQFANTIENQIRRKAGHDERPVPREPEMVKFDRAEMMRQVDWTKANTH